MAEENKQTAGSGTISVGTAAQLLMVSEERVRQLVKLGYVPRVAKGQFPLVGVVQGYIKFLKDEERRSSKTATASRMQDAKAAKIEMELAEKRRELIPVEDHRIVVDIIAGKVRDEFAGLPARFTRDMKLRRELETEVNASLNRVAGVLDASADFIEKGGELPAGAGGDDT